METVVEGRVVGLCLHHVDDVRHIVNVEIIGSKVEGLLLVVGIGGLLKDHGGGIVITDNAKPDRHLRMVDFQVGGGKPELCVDLGEAAQSGTQEAQYKQYPFHCLVIL